MINNYLDYVKSQRKAALKEMRFHRNHTRSAFRDWDKGFHAGHAQARSFENRHWRKLQKDIEAHNEAGDTLAWIPEGKGLIKTILVS